LETIRIQKFKIVDAVDDDDDDDDGVFCIPRNRQRERERERERGGRKKAESILNPFFCERLSHTIKPAFGIKWGDGALRIRYLLQLLFLQCSRNVTTLSSLLFRAVCYYLIKF
jgi:hypothetical protein